MNLLAHAYLSFDFAEVLVGNMIGDSVKGTPKNTFSPNVRKGIFLHRKIDSFTDAHPVIAEAKKAFKPLVGLYAGAFVDVAFDYFLANDLEIKSPKEWEVFAQEVYKTLAQHLQILPTRFAQFFPFMQQEDWLYNYRFLWGIEKSFHNVLRRAQYLSTDVPIMQAFEENIAFLKMKYQLFFPELERYIKAQLR